MLAKNWFRPFLSTLSTILAIIASTSCTVGPLPQNGQRPVVRTNPYRPAPAPRLVPPVSQTLLLNGSDLVDAELAALLPIEAAVELLDANSPKAVPLRCKFDAQGVSTYNDKLLPEKNSYQNIIAIYGKIILANTYPQTPYSYVWIRSARNNELHCEGAQATNFLQHAGCFAYYERTTASDAFGPIDRTARDVVSALAVLKVPVCKASSAVRR